MAYSYKTVPFLGRSQDILNPGFVAEQLNQVINENEASGWSFYQVNSVNIFVAGSQPGCLRALFGAKAYAPYERRFDMVIFRRLVTQETSNPSMANAQPPVMMAPDDADAKCPKCNSLITHYSTQCWKCKAPFGGGSSLKPLPL